MISRVRVAIRFFFLGLAVGVLLAPRSGIETRRLLRQRADRFLNDLLDAATLGAYDSSSRTNGTNGNQPAGFTDGHDTAEATPTGTGFD
jgi:hypothetical protein